MLLLRVTSGRSVHGVKSDDGFIIGRFTLAGTYNLLMIGAAVGLLGAGSYQWARPWRVGPTWLRSLTCAPRSAVVVGAMFVHADGIDFRALMPTALAVLLFVVLPVAFDLAVGRAVESVDRPIS